MTRIELPVSACVDQADRPDGGQLPHLEVAQHVVLRSTIRVGSSLSA